MQKSILQFFRPCKVGLFQVFVLLFLLNNFYGLKLNAFFSRFLSLLSAFNQLFQKPNYMPILAYQFALQDVRVGLQY